MTLPSKPILITNYQQGKMTRNSPFQIPMDAWEELINVWPWRGRMHRRRPAISKGRLKRDLTGESLGNSGASPWSFNIFTLLGLAATEPDASIKLTAVSGSPDTTITIAGPIVFQDNGDGHLTSTTPGNTGTINYATGDVTLTHTAGAGAATTIDTSYYPAFPCMGIYTYEQPEISFESTIAWDTKYAYIYSTSTGDWSEFTPGSGTTWQGGNSDFFWATTYWQDSNNNSLFWATNFAQSAGDPMYFSNGSTWTQFAPTINSAGDQLHQARFIFPFKGRLCVLNTYEGASLGASVHKPNRLRWSQVGEVVPSVSSNAWRDDLGGRGGYIDCPTGEHIVSFYPLRDVVIVGLEHSTWIIRYTGNEALPLVWQSINSELGCESSFSTVGFDRGVLQIGPRSINSADGNDVTRIDEQIPDLVFRINNAGDGLFRVIGARDYRDELAIWTMPLRLQSTDTPYPDRLLVYNYVDNAWSESTDQYTFLGYLRDEDGERWRDLGGKYWDSYWVRWINNIEKEGFPFVLGGNSQGFMSLWNVTGTEAPIRQITAYTSGAPAEITSPDHNLQTGDIIEISGALTASLATILNGGPYLVEYKNANVLKLYEWDGTTYLPHNEPSETYIGGGLITPVHNFIARSRQFSLIESGMSILIGQMDFLMNTNEGGEITCKMYADWSNNTPLNNDSTAFFNSAISTGAASTRPGYDPENVLRRFFCSVQAQFIQFLLTLDDNQINDATKNNLPVDIFAITIWAKPSGDIIP